MAEYSKLVMGESQGEGEAKADSQKTDKVVTVTFKLPESTLERLNERAREMGVTRSFLIRRGISEVLAGGSHSRISRIMLAATFDTFDENGAPIEHSRMISGDTSDARLVRLVTELTGEADRLTA